MHNSLCKKNIVETESRTCELKWEIVPDKFFSLCLYLTDRWMANHGDSRIPGYTPSLRCQDIITMVLALSRSNTGFHKPEILFQGKYCVKRRYFTSKAIYSFDTAFPIL